MEICTAIVVKSCWSAKTKETKRKKHWSDTTRNTNIDKLIFRVTNLPMLTADGTHDTLTDKLEPEAGV